ncbi:DUF4307 domain-containing protein [Aeromicrobium sp.]|uniref:DUF4307 domain-containing protein n=1 Tax=Aeromicrobium sp. TaxID=1871063 RepID=UPI003C4D125F
MTDLAGRYGTRGRPRWLWPVVATIGVLIGIVWAAWVAFQPKPVSAQLYGYEVVDDHHVTVSLNVHRPQPLAVRCTVYAQAEDHSTVGEKTVTVPANDREDARIRITLETERRAVTGVLRTCQSLD